MPQLTRTVSPALAAPSPAWMVGSCDGTRTVAPRRSSGRSRSRTAEGIGSSLAKGASDGSSEATLGSLGFYHRREGDANISVFDSLCQTRTRADSSVSVAVRPTLSYATSYRIAPINRDRGSSAPEDLDDPAPSLRQQLPPLGRGLLARCHPARLDVSCRQPCRRQAMD